MADLLSTQLQAIQVLTEAEEYIEKTIKEIGIEYTTTPYMEKRLQSSLRGLVETGIVYGKLKSTHERFLTNGTKKEQKDG